MNVKNFNNLVYDALEFVKTYAPIDTGNLKYNAIRVVYETPNRAKIIVDQSIAPYMPYTNEPWISPKWHGKKNPNEHWWQDTVETLVWYICEEYKGKLIR